MNSLPDQKAFLNNFQNVVSCRADIREDIKRYQDTLSYALSKVDYSVGEGIYMLPSNINLNIRLGTAGYNNEILVSDGMFSLGRNNTVNLLESHRAPIVHALMSRAAHTPASEAHKEERVALVLVLTSAFRIWYAFVNERHETR